MATPRDSYVDNVLALEPEERRVSPAEGDAEVAASLADPEAVTGELALEEVRAAAEAERPPP